MSGLRERLLRHTRPTGESKQTDLKGNEPEEVHERGQEEAIANAEHLSPAWRIVGGELLHNAYGAFVMRRRRYPSNAFHGIYQLRELASWMPALHAFIDENISSRPFVLQDLLFLDTETTGLGVGAGNVPFMIGIGYYEEDAFAVEQLFIRNPAEELAMLHYLLEKLNHSRTLVTYNGRTFDWPLILNRYVMNRLQHELPEVRHIDLLHPSRSVWRNTLVSCKLSQVEEDRLGVRRLHDVPGSLAPTLYFQYLSDGNPTLLHGVFEHNENDILTLASLLIHFAKLMSGEIDYVDLPMEERFRSALWLDKMGLPALAEPLLDNLWHELVYGGDTEFSADLTLRLAAWYKKRTNHARAAGLWHRCVDQRDGEVLAPIEPHVELAIFYEHRERDFVKALRHSEAALHIVRQRKSLRRHYASGITKEQEQQIVHRIERLKRKACKSS